MLHTLIGMGSAALVSAVSYPGKTTQNVQHCLDTWKVLHTLIGTGSTALVSAVSYPGKTTQNILQGQRSTKKKKKKNPPEHIS